jgi:hypothetical protein
MKRFLICTVRTDGRREIHDHTNLSSEVDRFENLGYEVVPRSQFYKTTAKKERVAA